MAGGRTSEQLAVFGGAGDEAAGGKKKLSVLDTHETIQPILFALRIVDEGLGGLFLPRAAGGAKPLVAVKGLAPNLPVAAAKFSTKL